MASTLSFGEMLLRLQAPGHERLLQSPRFDAFFGGAEANVAVGLAALGHDSAYVTRLPAGPLGDAALAALRAAGVDVAGVVRGGGRLGLYFAERGAGLRPSAVVYDRSGSSFATLDPTAFDFPRLLRRRHWLHVSGITPALGDGPRQAGRAALAAARGAGVATSFDLNYRRALWSAAEAREAIEPLLAGVDLLLASGEDLRRLLAVAVPDPASDAGAARRALADLARRFDLRRVAVTLATEATASDGVCQALLYDAAGDLLALSPRRAVRLVDRIGAGDAFAAVLIHAHLAGLTPQQAVDLGIAALVWHLTTAGDFPRFARAELERLAGGPPETLDR